MMEGKKQEGVEDEVEGEGGSLVVRADGIWEERPSHHQPHPDFHHLPYLHCALVYTS